MTSRTAKILVIFIVACLAFCMATVFASMTGPISILPNESDTGGVLDNLSAITDSDDNYNSYGYDDSNDYSNSYDDSSDDSSSEPKVETTTSTEVTHESTKQVESNSNVETTSEPSSSSSSSGSSSSGSSQGSNVETTVG